MPILRKPAAIAKAKSDEGESADVCSVTSSNDGGSTWISDTDSDYQKNEAELDAYFKKACPRRRLRGKQPPPFTLAAGGKMRIYRCKPTLVAAKCSEKAKR